MIAWNADCKGPALLYDAEEGPIQKAGVLVERKIATERAIALRARRAFCRARKVGRDRDATSQREELRVEKRKLRRLINASKLKRWKNFCTEVDAGVWGKGYRIATKAIKGHDNPQTMTENQTMAIVGGLIPTHREANWVYPQLTEASPLFSRKELDEVEGKFRQKYLRWQSDTTKDLSSK